MKIKKFVRGGVKKYVGFVKSMEGEAEPSLPYMYFTNLTYFYVWSGTDKIAVLFRRGPLFFYPVLRKIRKFIRTADKLTTSKLARKCDVTL